MISQYEEPQRGSTPKGSALAKLMRRTVPEDISQDHVFRSTSLRNRPVRAQKQPEISIQQQPEANILQPFSRDSSDYDSDGEPKLPPPSIGRGLPADFELRFWGKSPDQAPSTGKKRKPSRETIETYFPRHQLPERLIGQPIDNPNIIEDFELVQQPDRREKMKLCGALEAQLSRLQDDLRQLEQTLKDLQSTGDTAQFDGSRLQNLLPLLATDSPSCLLSHVDQKRPPLNSLLSSLLPFSALQYAPETINEADEEEGEVENQGQPENRRSYLDLFAPLSLSIDNKSSATPTIEHCRSDLRMDIIHRTDLILSAPQPFGAHMFKVALSIAIDIIKQCVLSITVPPAQPMPLALREWIDARLSNNLFERDVSGLCWGICQYWEATIQRAELWSRLDRWHASISTNMSDSQTSSASIDSPSQTFNMNRSCFSIHAGEPGHGAVHILITCQIHLDCWTGKARLKPNLSILKEGSNARSIEDASSVVFKSLLQQNQMLDVSDIATSVEIVSSTVLNI